MLIASKNSKLNEEKAYILGLLHDIGRRKYLKGMALVLPEGFTLIEKRFVETALKSGINSSILCKWRAVLDIKKDFENKIGCSIYGLLPNIIENTFGKMSG